MRKVLAYIIYIPLQILFLPLMIIGGVYIFYKQMYVSKRYDVSSTAIEIINGRWTMDKFGLRKDPATVKLFDKLPNTTSIGQWMTLTPLYILKKIAGENLIYPIFKEAPDAGISSLVISRTNYFDQILSRLLKKSEQFVVMGAGFDTRCYGTLVEDRHQLYELDKVTTQTMKRTSLQEAGVDTSRVNFVEVDFEVDSWPDKLTASGYDSTAVTTFLLEGVTLYLSEHDVRTNLEQIKAIAPKGSTIVADFYSLPFVRGELFPGAKALKITDEEFGYGVDFNSEHQNNLEMLIIEAEMKLGEVHHMGSNTKKGTYMAIAEILI